MSRSFSGTNLVQATGMTAIDTGPWTEWAWLYLPTGASVSTGENVLWSSPTATTVSQRLNLQGGTLKPGCSQAFSAGTGFANQNSSVALPNDTWVFLVGTFNDSTATCHLYRGTLAAAMSQDADTGATGSGTRATGATTLTLGNGGFGSAPFTIGSAPFTAGYIGGAGIAATLLTLGQMEALRLGFAPWQIGKLDLRAYFPLDETVASAARDLSPAGLSTTVTGTTLHEGPPVRSGTPGALMAA